MIRKLLSKNKFDENDLIKELLNPEFNSIKVEQIQAEIKSDVNELFLENELLFHLCCKKGLIKSVEWLINNNINLELENEEGQTAIFYAIQSRNSGILQILVENNVNINHLDKYKRTVLQDAVISANNRIIDYLIERSALLNNCDIHDNNLIFDALANGNFDVIAKIASLNEKININQINEEGISILHKDIVLKDTKLALLLMDFGANPLIKDKNGKNFLFYAVSKGIVNFEILNKAVKLGCDINSRCDKGNTILTESINYFLNTPKDDNNTRQSHLQMVKALILRGVNINALDKKNENELFHATRSEEKELIEIFLNNSKIDINHQNIEGDSVLQILVLNGVRNIELIKSYLAHGANPNLKNRFNKTIIETLIDIVLYTENKKQIDEHLENILNEDGEYATVLEAVLKSGKVDLNQLTSKGEPLFFEPIAYFNFKLFKLLKNLHVNISQRDKNGNTIIFKLMDFNTRNEIKDKKIYLTTLQGLINAGVDINARNKDELTPLHKAVSENCIYTLKLLLESKPDYLATDSKGRTILHTCIFSNTTKYFKLIHSYNQDIINIPDNFGVTPINYAAFMGKKNLVIEMLDEGALVNNPNEKDPKILQFFEKFHKNILDFTKNVGNNIDKVNLGILIGNMIKEYDIKSEDE